MLSTSDRLRQVTYPGTPAPQVQHVYENTTYPYALTGLIDEDGNRFASWTYDASMRVNSSQHAGGADLTTVSYNMYNMYLGYVTVTNPLGQRTVYTILMDAGGGYKV